jgi:hypothetical protein
MADEDIIAQLRDAEGDIEDPVHEEVEFDSLWTELEARCKAASIKVEQRKDFEEDRYVRLYLPAGRQTEPIALFTLQQIKSLLLIQFEKYVFLGDYAAICCYEDKVIEAAITGPFLAGLLRQISGIRPNPAQPGDSISSLEVSNPMGPEKLFLGPGTPALTALTGNSTMRPAFRIEGVAVSRHDDAVEILERIGNAFFFQLDLLRNIPLALMRRRRPFRIPGRRSARTVNELEFPKSEYDRDPISLYWYARSARGMPLLQFLAYYQTIEYYFPAYSQAEARRKIRNILKSPTFRPERDADVARILLAARLSGAGFGEERSQLRATLNECVEPGALRSFFTESEERASFFSAKTDKLTDVRIPIKNPDADLRNDAADRIYNIRCKIVHTKSGGREGEVELLLPFSKEAELLYADIELIQFVAREVLVSASTPLRLRDEIKDK